MNREEIKDKALELLAEICEEEDVKENLDLELFENELLDSLTVAELLVAIEDEFGLVIPPTEITREQIGTPGRIVSLILSRADS